MPLSARCKRLLIRSQNLRQVWALLKGGGLNLLQIFTTAQSSGGAPATNQSYVTRFIPAAIAGFVTGSQMQIQYQGGTNGTNTGATVTGATIVRTTHGSTPTVDTTTITRGGLSSWKIPSGFDQGINPAKPSPITSDIIPITVDTSHDYYIITYFASGSGVEVGFWASPPTNGNVWQAAQALALGDDTHAADMNVFPQSGAGSLQPGVTGGTPLAVSAISWG